MTKKVGGAGHAHDYTCICRMTVSCIILFVPLTFSLILVLQERYIEGDRERVSS